MKRPWRVDLTRKYQGQIKASGSRHKVEGGCLHWGVGTAALEAIPEARVRNLIEVNAPRGTGYSRVIAGGVVYVLQPWRKVVGHAGGQNATVPRPNTRLYGVCIAYVGPSQHPRGIEGEVEGPHHKLGTAWYPPIARQDVLLAAHSMRALRAYGLDEVVGHSEINRAKSDPFPVDMDEFRALVLDDTHWRASLAAHTGGPRGT